MKVIIAGLIVSASFLSLSLNAQTNLDVLASDSVKQAKKISICCYPVITLNTFPVLYIVNQKPMSLDSLRTIDPETIKEITILKDAAATGIYGQAGQNGVVLVTLKKDPIPVKEK